MEERFKVYIKGVQGRGNEVIKAFTDLGAENPNLKNAGNPEYLFFITHKHCVSCAIIGSEIGEIIMDNYREIKLPEQWRDGDLLVGRGGNLFAVFSHKDKDFSFVAYMQASEDGVQEYPNGVICFREDYRLATDEEAKRFHELLHKHGKEWDAEKKKLVEWDHEKKKLVNRKRKPKFGKKYFVVNTLGCVDHCIWTNATVDNYFYNLGNCFPTREEAETMAEKVEKLFK